MKNTSENKTENIVFAGISGSLRTGSYNSMLLRSLRDLLPAQTELDILLIDEIPLYNADRDLPSVERRPKPVEAFRAGLARAHAIIFVSPEYNYSIPGTLKNAIDWASRGDDSPLIKKPVALMGATQSKWGTARMQQDFHPIFQYLDMIPVYKPEIYVAEAARRFDKEGRLTDEKAIELIRQKLDKLKDVALQHRDLSVY